MQFAYIPYIAPSSPYRTRLSAYVGKIFCLHDPTWLTIWLLREASQVFEFLLIKFRLRRPSEPYGPRPGSRRVVPDPE